MKAKFFKVVVGDGNRPVVFVPEPKIEAFRAFLIAQGAKVITDFELVEQVTAIVFLNAQKDEAARLVREWSQLPLEAQQ